MGKVHRLAVDTSEALEQFRPLHYLMDFYPGGIRGFVQEYYVGMLYSLIDQHYGHEFDMKMLDNLLEEHSSALSSQMKVDFVKGVSDKHLISLISIGTGYHVRELVEMNLDYFSTMLPNLVRVNWSDNFLLFDFKELNYGE